MAPKPNPERPRQERRTLRRIIVIGGGVSGLTAAVTLCEANVPVLLLCSGNSRRAPSLLDSDGFNAVLEQVGETDSIERHFEDSVRASAFLAAQPPLLAMVKAAPRLLSWLTRLGVPFNRSTEGQLLSAYNSGSNARRTAYCDVTTGQQILYALDEQARRFESVEARDRFGAGCGEPLLVKHEGVSLSSLILDDERRAVGVAVREQLSGEVKTFRTDAICLASGGHSGLFAGTSSSLQSNGSAAACAFRQGALYANAEFVQFRPLALPGPDKARGLSELLRANGGRLWSDAKAATARTAREVPPDERRYVLERDFPRWGNRAPTQDAARAIAQAEQPVFLDVTQLAAGTTPFEGWFSHQQKLGQEDARTTALQVHPAADQTLGGLWVDYEVDAAGALLADSPRNHATSISGLFAAGECAYQYKGAGMLSGNALLSCVFGGQLAARAIQSHIGSLERSSWDLPPSVFEKAEQRERHGFAQLLDQKPTGNSETAFAVAEDLRVALTEGCGVLRTKTQLEQLLATLERLTERAASVSINDRGSYHNQSLGAAKELGDALLLAQLTARAALSREESRGVHYRADLATARSEAPRLTLQCCSDGESIELVREFECHLAGQTRRVSAAVDTRFIAAPTTAAEESSL
jgi:succinate dehydrogenase / fumarate reductase flavoprotein subunit